jgi:FHS family L-fucose permease-like MFS transporter
MIMAIIGGALISALMGRVADACGVTLSYLVPGACFAAVFVYAVFSMRRDSTTILHEPVQIAE